MEGRKGRTLGGELQGKGKQPFAKSGQGGIAQKARNSGGRENRPLESAGEGEWAAKLAAGDTNGANWEIPARPGFA